MPIIREKDLLDFHKKIETLERDKEKLKELNDLNSKEFRKKNKIGLYLKILSVVLIISILGQHFFYKSSKEDIENNLKIYQRESKKDSVIVSEKQNLKEIDTFYYSVQIGVFKKLSLDIDSKKVKNLQKIQKNNLNTYIIGRFENYSQATKFKKELQKINFKDAFTVAFHNNEKIEIRKALNLSKESDKFLKKK